MKQAQGIVFKANHDDRVVVELDTGNDCGGSANEGKPKKVARWTKSSTKRA